MHQRKTILNLLVAIKYVKIQISNVMLEKATLVLVRNGSFYIRTVQDLIMLMDYAKEVERMFQQLQFATKNYFNPTYLQVRKFDFCAIRQKILFVKRNFVFFKNRFKFFFVYIDISVETPCWKQPVYIY